MMPKDAFAYAMGTYSDLHSYRSFWYAFGDTQQQWQSHCEHQKSRELLERLGWMDPESIVYDINPYGFRSTDLIADIDLAVFGDSYTFGVGLPQQRLWHSIVGQHMQFHVANFGVAGAAARTCFRLAQYWLPRMRPRHAIFVMPHSTRLEVAEQASDGFMTTPYLVSGHYHDEFLRKWWSTDFNADLEGQIIQRALQNLCQDLGVRCRFFNIESFEQLYLDPHDRARDLRHGGVAFQHKVAQHIVQDIESGQWH